MTVNFLEKSPKIVELEPANEDYENIVVDLEYQDFILRQNVDCLEKINEYILFFENLSLCFSKIHLESLTLPLTLSIPALIISFAYI